MADWTDWAGRPDGPDRTGFDHDLAEAVATATRDVRLVPAGDVIRLGRRRARARRGRLAVAGVAVLGGAYTVVGVPGATTAPKPVSSATSAGARGDGLLSVEQWPEYATEHWQLKKEAPMYGIAPWMMTTSESLAPGAATYVSAGCDKSSAQFPIGGRHLATVQSWATVPKDVQQPDPSGGEAVYTYPDASEARQALTDAKDMLKASCPADGRQTLHAGVTTEDGVSWVAETVPQADGRKGPVDETHQYLVVVGDRVAMLMISDTDGAVSTTAHDAEVLAGMRAALAG